MGYYSRRHSATIGNLCQSLCMLSLPAAMLNSVTSSLNAGSAMAAYPKLMSDESIYHSDRSPPFAPWDSQASEGGMIRLETLIELKYLNSSCSSSSSYWNSTISYLPSDLSQQYLPTQKAIVLDSTAFDEVVKQDPRARRGRCARRVVRKGTKGVSTNGVTANCMFFDRGICWALPLTCFDLP